MVEYLEKMIPRADLSFFGLGNGFGGKDLEFRLREKGVAVPSKLIRLKCANHHRNGNQG